MKSLFWLKLKVNELVGTDFRVQGGKPLFDGGIFFFILGIEAGLQLWIGQVFADNNPDFGKSLLHDGKFNGNIGKIIF